MSYRHRDDLLCQLYGSFLALMFLPTIAASIAWDHSREVAPTISAGAIVMLIQSVIFVIFDADLLSDRNREIYYRARNVSGALCLLSFVWFISRILAGVIHG